MLLVVSSHALLFINFPFLLSLLSFSTGHVYVNFQVTDHYIHHLDLRLNVFVFDVPLGHPLQIPQ